MNRIYRAIGWVFSLALSFTIVLGAAPVAALAVQTSYIDVDGGSASVDAAEITAEMTSWGNGGESWYVAQGNVAIGSRARVTGNVRLILTDGATLDVNGGVYVPIGASLTIYGQTGGTGKLTATAVGPNAGIGGNQGSSTGPGGTITINGGIVIANGGNDGGGNSGAGIGGGLWGSVGDITINGGTVYATGNWNAAGIGTGTVGSCGAITVSGGVVTATGQGDCPGIGGNNNKNAGTFSTGENGNAVIIANGISDQSRKSSWSGVIFEGVGGQVYAPEGGKMAVPQNWSVPKGYTLTVPWGMTLEIPAGTSLDVEGTLVNENIIEVAGTLDWSGGDAKFTNNGVVTTLEGGSVSPTAPVFKNELTVTGGEEGADYDFRGAVLIILKGTPLTVTGVSDAERIVVNPGVKAALTLDGVIIDLESAYNAIDLLDGASLNLTLEGQNTLKPGGGKAGIHVPGGTSLVIDGPGSLSVDGGRAGAAAAGGAGIGADYGGDLGNIVINGGTVVAQSTNTGSAGIGEGGWRDPAITPGSSVTINGGNVTASAVSGSGEGCINAETVTIYGGHITALAANIGGSISAKAVTITGGIVDVPDDKLDGANVTKSNCIVFKNKVGQIYTSKDKTASIAQDWEIPSGYTLTVPWYVTLAIPAGSRLDVEGALINEGVIEVAGTLDWEGASFTNDGVVTTSGEGKVTPDVLAFKNNLAVAGGVEGTDYEVRGAVTVILSDMPLTVKGTADAERIIIGSGVHANLTLSGVTIDIQSGNAIDLLDGASLNLTLEGQNTLKPGGGKAGIHVPGGASLVIDGPGSLSVDGGRAGAAAAGGAGIGADNGGDLGDITINGGTVVARSTNTGSAGIGAGGWSGSTADSSVTVTGGHVTASVAAGAEGSINAEAVTITGGIVDVLDDKLDGSNVTKSGCIIFKNKAGQTYVSDDKTVSIAQDWEMPSDYSLIVSEGVTLEIAGSLTWTGAKIENYGTIKLAEGGLVNPALVSVAVPDVAVEEDTSATFAATVSSVGAGDVPADIPYRWQTEDESGTWTDIEGATDAQLTLGNDGTEKDGARYRCVVILNGCTAYSAPATLTVLKPIDQCYTIDYAAETIAVVGGYEVYTAETGGDKIESGGSIFSYIGQKLYIQKSGSTTSGRREIAIPARPTAPSLSIDTAAEGVKIPDGYLYSADGDSGVWTRGDDSLVEVEPGASVYICKPAVASGDDAAFRSEVQTLTAPARVAEPADVAIDYRAESLTGAASGVEYAVGDREWTDCTEGIALTAFGWDGTQKVTVRFRTAATDEKYASEPVTLDIPVRPEAPDAPAVVDRTDASIAIEAAAGVQYRLGKDGVWTTSDTGSLTFEGLDAGTTYTVHFRFPASSDQFASAEGSSEFITKTSAATAPEVAYEVTVDSVTLQYDAAWEYSSDGVDWKRGEGANVFAGLTPATQYTYYVRAAETETAEASQVATVTCWTAHAAPAAGEGYTIDYAAETVTAQADYQVRLFDDDEWATGPIGITPGGAFQVRRAADTGNAPASEATAATAPSRPAAPKLSIDTKSEGVTIPEGYFYNTTDADYSAEGWKPGEGASVAVRANESIFIYEAATDSSFKSEVQALTAPARSDAPAVPAINYETESLSGTAADMEYSLDGKAWAACSGDMPLSTLGWDGRALTVRFRTAADGSYASDPVTLDIPARPAAPSLSIDNAVEGVKIPNGYLYSADGTGDPGAWTRGDGSLVTVAPQGSIYICQAATGDAFRSEAQALTAPARADVPIAPGIDYENEALTGIAAGVELSVDSEAWAICSGDVALSTLGWGGDALTVRFRAAATDENYASDPVTLDIPARPAAPSAPVVTDRTDTSIAIGADAGVQYRLGEDGEWLTSDAGSLTFEDLTAGTTYTVCARTPATADRFASAEASVQVTTKSAAAAAPEVGAAAVTDTSVTLPHDPAWEYSTDRQNWSGTHEFTGLTPATQYTYYVRAAETETAEASQVATVTVWTAYAVPTGVQGGEGQIIGVTADMEYSGDGGATWTTCPDGSITGLSAGEYLVRRMASGDIPASPYVTVTVTRSNPPYVPPAPTGPDWADVAGAIEDAVDGDQIIVDMSGETELPGEVLEKLAGSNVTLVLDMGGGVSWEINGADIPEGSSFTPVNLGVEMDTSGIPIEVTNLVTGESGVVQVALSHEGPFGFELTLVAPLGTENEGLVANLYHYDAAEGVLRFESFGTIDENGTARLRLDHASEWAIALDTHSHALPFADTAEGQWYSESVRWAWLHGVMTGYSDGSGHFGTDNALTRAEMATILCRLSGEPAMDTSGLPADCEQDEWYANGVAWALEAGVFHGYGDGSTFGPNDTITREQAACVLYNRALAAGEDVSARADLTGFSDAGELSDWAYDAMSWAVSQEIFNGTDAGELQPTRALTRAEGAAILCNWETRS